MTEQELLQHLLDEIASLPREAQTEIAAKLYSQYKNDPIYLQKTAKERDYQHNRPKRRMYQDIKVEQARLRAQQKPWRVVRFLPGQLLRGKRTHTAGC